MKRPGPLRDLPEDERDKLCEQDLPRNPGAMLATLTQAHFSSRDWIYERKLDGERCLVMCDGSTVTLMSRNQRTLNDTYPELVEALESQLDTPLVADGEIVAFDGRVTSFSRLQQRIGIDDPDEARATGVKVCLYLFDLTHYDGLDLRQLPLRRRKILLRKVLVHQDPIRYTPHRNEDGEAYYEEACRKGWEGIIAKRADSAYVTRRSRNWLKFKCVNRQEFVIGGYTDPKGERHGFGALLLGYYEGEALVYAGKVGTGFDDEMLTELGDRLESLATDEPPYADPDKARGKGVHWVKPVLVGEVGFTEWTDAGELRHPRFVGLRDDKAPEEVVRERPREP